MNTQPLALRPYQQKMIGAALEGLKSYGTALCVSPTGSGKTIILSQIIKGLLSTGKRGRPRKMKVVVIQHTKELIQQNRAKFEQWCPGWQTSTFNSTEKDTNGAVIFAMVQTLVRHYKKLPKIDVLVVDEAHHVAARSYEKIVSYLKKKNPALMVLGMTATPNRGDRKGLKSIFNRVTSQISLIELIADEYLVPARIFTIDFGQQDKLKTLLCKDNARGKTVFIDNKVAWDNAGFALTNNTRLNEEVVRNWQEKAAGKKTVIFCSTIAHAKEVRDTFERYGVKATHVNGDMPAEERSRALQRFESTGEDAATIITNAMMLTEGWDHPPIECIVLLRPMSCESTYTQMIGRGLRPAPDKTECTVLDFGMSSLRHKVFNLDVDLKGRKEKKKSFVGDKFSFTEGYQKEDFSSSYSSPISLKEMAPHLQSSYLWEHFKNTMGTEFLMAGGFDQTAFIIKQPEGQNYVGLVKKGQEICFSKTGSFYDVLFACEKVMKTMNFWKSPMGWMHAPPSEKQLTCLSRAHHYTRPKNSYQAGLLVSFSLSKRKIQEATDFRVRI